LRLAVERGIKVNEIRCFVVHPIPGTGFSPAGMRQLLLTHHIPHYDNFCSLSPSLLKNSLYNPTARVSENCASSADAAWHRGRDNAYNFAGCGVIESVKKFSAHLLRTWHFL
jgi:hypothetical protein